MTFELSAELAAVRDRAREFASDHLLDSAAVIDRHAAVPAALAREAEALLATGSAQALVVAVEELATASAAVAAVAGLGPVKTGGDGQGLSGLRGLPSIARPGERGRLALAAVALGIGRAALDAALDELRAAATAPEGEEKPHWVLADAATELDAARLLTWQAAERIDDADAAAWVAMARLAASRAAQQAVDAALRLAGPGGLREGALLERLARDVRAIALIAGTEEDQRAAVAAGVLPDAGNSK
jgi:alkylation response protein AidB-like acyl-CoA dehydrogenase